MSSPSWIEGWVNYKGIDFNRYLNMIVDIRSVSFDKNPEGVITPVGWTIVPIFSVNRFILSGIY